MKPSTYLVRYLLRGEILGACFMPSFPLRGIQGNVPVPLVYVCPYCGDAWAKREVLGGGHFRVTTKGCPDCSPGFLFIYGEAPQYIQHAPTEVLQRELSIIALLKDPTEFCSICILQKPYHNSNRL